MLNDQQKYKIYEKIMEDMKNHEIISKDLFKIINHQQRMNLLTKAYCLDQEKNIQMMQNNMQITMKENESIWLECLSSPELKNGKFLNQLKVSDSFLLNCSSKHITKLMKKDDETVAHYIQMFPTVFFKNLKISCLYAIKQDCKKSTSLLSYLCKKEDDIVFFLGCLVSFDKIDLLSQLDNKDFIHKINYFINDKEKIFQHLKQKNVPLDLQNLTASFNQYLCDFITKEISIEEVNVVKRKLKKL